MWISWKDINLFKWSHRFDQFIRTELSNKLKCLTFGKKLIPFNFPSSIFMNFLLGWFSTQTVFFYMEKSSFSTKIDRLCLVFDCIILHRPNNWIWWSGKWKYLKCIVMSRKNNSLRIMIEMQQKTELKNVLLERKLTYVRKKFKRQSH